MTATKLLGILFDNKLFFIPHFKYLKTRCPKALEILKVLGHTQWRAESSILLQLYRTLIRSKLDYGCIIYDSARKYYISHLDTTHHQGLWLAQGVFRTSPIQSLYVEGCKSSRRIRKVKLVLQHKLCNYIYIYIYIYIYKEVEELHL